MHGEARRRKKRKRKSAGGVAWRMQTAQNKIGMYRQTKWDIEDDVPPKTIVYQSIFINPYIHIYLFGSIDNANLNS